MAVILNEPEKRKIISKTKDVDIISPNILPFEIGNALSAAYKKNKLKKEEASELYSIFCNIPVRLVDVNIQEALEIAVKYNIYAYDAYYLNVARRYKLDVLTLDQKMIEIAEKLNLKTVGIS